MTTVEFGPAARVTRFHDAPTLLVDGEPLPPMWYTAAAYDEPRHLRALGEAGIRVFFVEHQLAWRDPDAPAALVARAELILREVPQAWLVLRTGLYPPESWFDANPSELIQFEDGTPMETWFGKGTRCQCLASRRWREDQTRALGLFLDWLPAQAFAQRVIGFFLNAGGTGEWYIPGQIVQGERTIDHSSAFRTQFSDSLREQYGSDAHLRLAWNRPGATLGQPVIPTVADQAVLEVDRAIFAHYHGHDALPPAPPEGAAVGAFCNPDTHRHVADFYRALNHGCADSIIHFARYLRERTGDTKVIGAFYGSFGQHTGGTSSGVTRILDSGSIDFLASPGDYVNRKPGGVVAQREMQDAFRLRNCIFVVEEDTRTLATGWSHDWGVPTLATTLEVIKRDFGRNLSEDLSAWWFDMAYGANAHHWYDYPKVLELIRRQQAVAQAFYGGPRSPRPEIALVYDQDSMHYTSTWTLTDIGHRLRTWEIHRIGAPVAYHYLDDLALDNLPEYKLYVFMNAFVLDERQREWIRRCLARRSCTALWLYAPGLIHPDRAPRLSEDNLTRLTGIRTGRLPGPALPYCRVTAEGARLLTDVRQDRDYGWFADRESTGTIESWLQPQGMAQFTLLCPYLFGDDPAAHVLMRFAADGRPALVMTETGAQRTLVAYFKAASADLLRAVARLAGCHIYSDSDDILYASPHFVTLHASSSGEKVIRFPGPCDPFEIYEQAFYGRATAEIRVRLRMGETRTFHLHGSV